MLRKVDAEAEKVLSVESVSSVVNCFLRLRRTGLRTASASRSMSLGGLQEFDSVCALPYIADMLFLVAATREACTRVNIPQVA